MNFSGYHSFRAELFLHGMVSLLLQAEEFRAFFQRYVFSLAYGSAVLLVNQRTNGPVKAHLISLPSKAQNIQNLENIW